MKSLRLIRRYGNKIEKRSPSSGQINILSGLDLRSDTLTLPCLKMREILSKSLCGDDVYGEDIEIEKLEKLMAKILGKEEALFVMTGTMGNLLCILSLCGRGEEVICGHMSHISKYEQGNISQFGGVPFRTIPNEHDGRIDIKNIQSQGYFSNDDFHSSQTKEPLSESSLNKHRFENLPRANSLSDNSVISIENTHNMLGGIPLQLDYLRDLDHFAKENNAFIHTDGARLINAAISLNIPLDEICQYTDTKRLTSHRLVTMCFTKGLGCPIGAILAGKSEIVQMARRLRKGLGGQWRQGGIAAACCSHSIQNLEPILIDHENAKSWASDLEKAGLKVAQPKSNIVLVECEDEEIAAKVVAKLGEQELYVQQAADPRFIRAVFHRSVNYSLLERSISMIKNAFE